ncbi:MAG: c-type cytochrome [Thermoleophilia bacterium]
MLRRALIGGALVAGAVALAGCGEAGVTSSAGDLGNGKAKFLASCGSCHTLVDAGTQGKVGPDLDDAFQWSDAQGFEKSTFVQVVREQIRYPGRDNEVAIREGAVQMPNQEALGLSDKDSDDIAAYVGLCSGEAEVANECQAAVAAPPPPAPAPPESGAGEPDAAPGGDAEAAAAGKELFASAGCGSCHTLAAAGASGAVGPNLDETKPAPELVVDRVTNGKGAMPPFSGQLSAEEIDQIAAFVSSAAGQ